MLVIILMTITILFIIHFIHRHSRNLGMLKDIPGPPRLPILGNALTFNGTPRDTFLTLLKLQKTYGPIFKIQIGHKVRILLSGVKEVESLLSNNETLTKASTYSFLKQWLGDGLVVSTGEKWRSRRKIITPTFHFKILEQYVSVFDEQSTIMTEKLKNFALKGEIVDVSIYLALCTLDIICETAMGIKLNAQVNEENVEIVRATKSICTFFLERVYSFWKQISWLYPLSPDFWRNRKAVKVLHNHSRYVIQTRRRTMQQEENQNEDSNRNDDDIGKRKKLAFLDLLLKSTVHGEPLSDEMIHEEVNNFMFGGHDTTSTAISFALYNLAENPHVQDKVFNEINEIFGGDKDKPTTHKDLQQMKYLDLVIKESLRTHPPVPTLGRQLQEDTEINGYKIPAFTSVVVLVYCMNQDPKIWTNTDRFMPERFENYKRENPYAFVPFSAGPRNCIGQKFAMLEMKSILSKLIRHFEFQSVRHELLLSGAVVLKSLNGVKIKLIPRKY